jgi:hypothetical protein
MVEVHERVYIGGEALCRDGAADIAVVHACKTPCHQRAVGYRGSLPNTHQNYLVMRRPFDLFLNMIDPPQPLFKLPVFTEFLLFAAEHWDAGRSLAIHCNQGESRAPSLALVFLAKHLRVLPDDSFAGAAGAFRIRYSAYRPGAGIQRFLADNWTALDGA